MISFYRNEGIIMTDEVQGNPFQSIVTAILTESTYKSLRAETDRDARAD